MQQGIYCLFAPQSAQLAGKKCFEAAVNFISSFFFPTFSVFLSSFIFSFLYSLLLIKVELKKKIQDPHKN